VAVSAVGVVLFFGGSNGPFLDQLSSQIVDGQLVGGLIVGGLPIGSLLASLLGLLYFTLKTAFFAISMIWIRGTLPRLRYDQLMRFGWKTMLPLALINVALTAIVIVVFQGVTG
jgi:NADH-quinone oxidoreductase subunit H